MPPDNAYAELGLAPGATESEAKAAWRRMVSKWHPDRNDSAGAVARMQRINLAFEALRRAGFPSGAEAPAEPGAGPVNANPADANPVDSSPADSGRGPGASAAPRRTLRRKVRITLEQATLGCTLQLRGTERCRCADCAGSGVAALTGACAPCAGAGRVRHSGWYGLFSNLADCADCAGSGRATLACPACTGSGWHRSAPYRVSVRLPAGVRDGDELQVDAQRWAGRPAPGSGPAADLLIRVAVRPHPFFSLRDDGGLHCTLPVSGFAWIAHATVQVPTPGGWHRLRLDPLHTDYRIAGAGFPQGRRGPRGHLQVHVVPRFPDLLSGDQQILLDQLVATQSGSGAGADPALRAWQQTLNQHHRPGAA